MRALTSLIKRCFANSQPCAGAIAGRCALPDSLSGRIIAEQGRAAGDLQRLFQFYAGCVENFG